jgi:hypothetical protein
VSSDPEVAAACFGFYVANERLCRGQRWLLGADNSQKVKEAKGQYLKGFHMAAINQYQNIWMKGNCQFSDIQSTQWPTPKHRDLPPGQASMVYYLHGTNQRSYLTVITQQ